jgi:type II secretory pathway component PulF
MIFGIKVWFAKKAFLNVRADIYENLAAQLSNAGSRRVETLPEIFGAWAKRDAARGLGVATIYQAIEQRLRKGQTFSQALKGFVPTDEAMVLDAGEASGRLPEAFNAALTSQGAKEEMRGAMAGAMAQPIFNFLGLIVSSVALGKMLWPDLMATFAEKYWPTWCMPMIHFDLWVASNWFVLPLGLVLLPIYYVTLPTWTGRSRQFFDHIPPWSLYRDRNASSLLVVFAGLIKAGLTVDEAIKRISKTSTPYMKWHLSLMAKRMKVHGNDPIKTFQTGLFSQAILDRLGDSLRTRSPDEALSMMGEKSLKAILKLVKRSAAVANSMCMLVIGLLFAYSIAVQVIGAQDASSKYVNEMTRSR